MSETKTVTGFLRCDGKLNNIVMEKQIPTTENEMVEDKQVCSCCRCVHQTKWARKIRKKRFHNIGIKSPL